MKSLITLVGIILVIFGIATLAYNGFTYKSQENVAQMGNVRLTIETEKRILLSPYVSGISLVVGIIILALNQRRG